MLQLRRALLAAAVVTARDGGDLPICGANPLTTWDRSQRELLAPLDDGYRREVREAYGCGCGGERFDLRPLRIRRGMGGNAVGGSEGGGIGALASCAEATGSEPATCPWASMRDPFVGEVVRAYGWREAGELEAKYPDPGGVPNVLIAAIETYASAFNTARTHDIREDRKRREREAEERALAAK